MTTLATVSAILELIADELEIDTTKAQVERQVLFWLNTVYKNVVNAEEYDWRKKDLIVVTYPTGTVTSAGFTNGSNAINMTGASHSGIGDQSYDNFLLVSGEEGPYTMTTVAPSSVIGLTQPYEGATGTKNFTVYHTKYHLSDMREDWILSVYRHGDEMPLRRIHPQQHEAFVRYSIRTPGTPEYYYMEGVDIVSSASDKNVMLNLSPAPDAAYTLTVRTLIGPTTLTTSDTYTILPADFEEQVLVYGVGMLYCLQKRDQEGVQLYGSRYADIISNMMKRSNKEPGMAKRVVGYTIKDSGVREPKIPLEWGGWST